MALNQWFKFYGGEYLSDPKIASLSPQERSCWITLLCLASISSKPGTVEYLTTDALLQKSGIIWDPYHPEEWDNAQTVLDKFVRMKMIVKSEDGVIEMLNWEKRQETSLTNAERQRRYRENNEKVTGRVTKVTVDKIREDKILATGGEEIEESTFTEEEMEPRRSAPKFPNARVAFTWFPNRQKSWDLNTTELKHGELLFERGEEAVRGALGFAAKHQDYEDIPQILKPSDLERKWNELIAFAKRNGL